ncbi:Pyrrolo-quinoline quinone [Haloplanus rallus]|uniref:Pyrrolo-quinoline quinone n=1 Tax=Haloplanus rallus TaxID=1816183 RepID=A0A6B9FAS4_9EURY|nr:MULTISPECIES: PQQ-binding-like beta-propeller repeat protein [Haloplanus]QGX95847.1 Pyrrolo-quinoline quinone [Haloplanus rallus]
MPARRAALALLGGTLAAALSGCLGDDTDDPEPTTVTNRPVDAAGSVPQYQVDAGNGGRLDGPTPSSPTVAWRRTPARYDASQPVVDGDAVYVGFDGDLVKLAADTGDVAWTVDAGHASDATPAVHGDVVYTTVWNGGESVPRGLVAVDAADGTVRWRALTDNDVNASPTPTDDAVFVGGGYENGEVAAVEHDGTVRWRRDLGAYAAAPATVGDRVVYATGESASAVALDADTGETVWDRSLDGRAVAAPTVVGDAVLVADESGRVRALDAATGDRRWRTAVDDRVTHSVARGDGTAVVAHGGGVTGLGVEDGERRWWTEIDRDPTAPVVVGGTVLVGAGRAVIALGADGVERWRVETRERSYTDVVLGGVTGSPVAVDGTVLVATQAGDVYALDDG